MYAYQSCSCGAVASVRLRSLAIKQDLKMPRRAALLSGELDTSRASGHAYVVFETEESVPAALALNMVEYEDRHLRVDRAAANRTVVDGKSVKEDGGVAYDPTRSVFAGNLPLTVEDEDVIRFFSDGSLSTELRTAVEAVRVVRDRKTSLGKGIAFVLYKTRSAARSATLLDGRKLGGRPIRVTRGPAKKKKKRAAQGKRPAVAARKARILAKGRA